MKREFVKAQVSDYIKPEEFGIFYHIVTNPVIAAGLSNGGWIAGGFARAILAGESIVNYLYPEKSSAGVNAGDIDIFFPNKEASYSTAVLIEEKVNRKMKLQPYRFAIDCHLRSGHQMLEHLEKCGVNRSRISEVRVQIVLNPPDGFKPTLLETLDNFDLINCMVGIDGQHIYFPAEWEELEGSKSLKIAKSETPFLGRRLAKYLFERGYENISEVSRDLFVEWLARVNNNEFSDFFNPYHVRKEMMMSALDKLIERKAIPLTDIVLLVNKWNITKKQNAGGYGESTYVSIDWALDKLQNQTNIA
jgi:hypothetical protein